MFRTLLVPTDGSPLSRRALTTAAALARACGARVVVVHAYPVFHGGAYGSREFAQEALRDAYEREMAARNEAILGEGRRALDEAGVPGDCVAIASDHPWEAILAAARRTHCDAICMASHGRRGFAGVLLGSETQKVLTHATLPVLVIR